jgi:hypothetical protein
MSSPKMVMLTRVLWRPLTLASSDSQEPNLNESELHLYYHIWRCAYNNPSFRALKTAMPKYLISLKKLCLRAKTIQLFASAQFMINAPPTHLKAFYQHLSGHIG